MRCPKCHYLSFDPEPRCKNCGYDLDVDVEVNDDDSELALQVVGREPAPAPDLPLRIVRQQEARTEREPEPAMVGVGVGAEPSPTRRVSARAPNTTTELPLFVKAIAAMETSAPVMEPEPEMDPDPEPIPQIAVPSTSRPLAVRRPVPEPAKSAPRVERRVGPIDHDLLDDLRRLDREAARWPKPSADSTDEPVPLTVRLGAASLDGLLLGGIGAFVLWATLKVSNAGLSDLGLAALVPLVIFLTGVGIAYLLMFTVADGQTVGKMLMGIRVVADGDNGDARLTLGQAAGRAFLAPLSLGALGLGWLPMLFGRGLTLHDRLAHTRVVRA